LIALTNSKTKIDEKNRDDKRRPQK